MRYEDGIANLKQALKFLMWCRLIHWRYTKHPNWCRGYLGSVEHHSYCVKRYTEIINLIKKHCGDAFAIPANRIAEAQIRSTSPRTLRKLRKTESAETGAGLVTRRRIRTRPSGSTKRRNEK